MLIVQKAIIKKQNKYLVLLRSLDDEFFPGYWDLPGGLLESKEKPNLSVEREVKKDTSLIVDAFKVVGAYQSFIKSILCRFIVCKLLRLNV